MFARRTLYACLFGLSFASLAQAAEPRVEKRDTGRRENAAVVQTPHVMRMSAIRGMAVHDLNGQDIGKIEDLMLNADDGKIEYAALSFGTFFGLGGKHFAIPWHQLTLRLQPGNNYFVLDVTKDQLANAPGFDPNHWPEAADTGWMHDVNAYYGQAHSGKVVSAGNGELVMSDAVGANRHTHMIGADTKITLNDKEATLDQLREGQNIKVFTKVKDGKQVVTRVEARS